MRHLFIVHDPRDEFRVRLIVAYNGTYTTLTISSPCVTPSPGARPG